MFVEFALQSKSARTSGLNTQTPVPRMFWAIQRHNVTIFELKIMAVTRLASTPHAERTTKSQSSSFLDKVTRDRKRAR